MSVYFFVNTMKVSLLHSNVFPWGLLKSRCTVVQIFQHPDEVVV
jgi:hypothetical protein